MPWLSDRIPASQRVPDGQRGGDQHKAAKAPYEPGHGRDPVTEWLGPRTALRKQSHGYSAGTSAFFVSMIWSRPMVAFDVLRLIAYALRDFRHGSENQRSGHISNDSPSTVHFEKAARGGLVEGALICTYEAIGDRRQPVASDRDTST
jgi:hypothetical protein